MYKLSVEFKTVSDLQAFIGKLDNTTVSIEATATTKAVDDGPNYEEPKKAASRAKKTAPAQEEVTLNRGTQSVSVEPVKQPEPVKPAIQPEVVRTPAPVTEIDRAALIARASALVATLKSSGLGDDQLMPNIHAVYAAAGCPLNLKISQFDDAHLSKFMPLFELKVQSIVAQKAPAPAGSFI